MCGPGSIWHRWLGSDYIEKRTHTGGKLYLMSTCMQRDLKVLLLFVEKGVKNHKISFPICFGTRIMIDSSKVSFRRNLLLGCNKRSFQHQRRSTYKDLLIHCLAYLQKPAEFRQIDDTVLPWVLSLTQSLMISTDAGSLKSSPWIIA